MENSSSPLEEAIKLKEEGNDCYRKKKYTEANILYNKALEKCPETNKSELAFIYQNRAAVCEMLKIFPEMKENCSKALEYNPLYAKAYLRRAKAHEATKNLMECLEDVTAAAMLEQLQNGQIAKTTETYLEHIRNESSIDSVRKHYATRKPTLPSKNFITRYLQSFIADPLDIPMPEVENPTGYIKAKIELDLGNYSEIIPACSEELESSDSSYNIEATLLRGTFYILEENFEKARKDLDAVINNSEADETLRANALIKRGRHHINFQAIEIGLNDFNEAEELLPNNPDVHFHRGLMFSMLHRIDDALLEFGKVVKLAPNYADAYVRKCDADYHLVKDAVNDTRMVNEIKAVVEKFPDFPEAYHLLAEVYIDKSNFEKAKALYDKVIERFPMCANTYVKLGYLLLLWKDDTTGAIELMNKAIEIDDSCSYAYIKMSEIEFQRENFNRGIALMDRGISLIKIPQTLRHLFKIRNCIVAEKNCVTKLELTSKKLE